MLMTQCCDSSPAGLECALNADLHGIANWLNDNKLILNVDKTKAMLIGSGCKLRKLLILSLSALKNQLDSVRSFKYPGVVLSSNFKCTERVEHVISKVNQRLGLLRRVKHLLRIMHAFFITKALSFPSLIMLLAWDDKDNCITLS